MNHSKSIFQCHGWPVTCDLTMLARHFRLQCVLTLREAALLKKEVRASNAEDLDIYKAFPTTRQPVGVPVSTRPARVVSSEFSRTDPPTGCTKRGFANRMRANVIALVNFKERV